jgi:membrane associated rhomboid family serine protease
MLIPLGTDQPLRKTAWCTYGLIAINFFCHFFLTQTVPDYSLFPPGVDTAHIDPQFMPMTTVPHESMPLVRNGLAWYQFITFQFANTGLLILIGHMIFLFGLGRALENKIGHVGFLAIYLLGGAFAGLCHITATVYPVSGAAGSVCAVAAAFLVIMPNTVVRVLYFIYFIGVIELSGLTFVLAYVGFDLLFTFSGIRSSQGAFSVVYITHVAGYAFGLAAGFGLLLTGLVPKSHNDLIHMIQQYRRRQAFAEQVRSSGQPWLNPVEGKTDISRVLVGSGAPLTPRQEEVLKLRAQILEQVGATRFDAASGLYDKLLEIDPTQTLTRQAQFDLANHLFSAGRHDRAAVAYERFLETYKTDPDCQQIKLVLAIIYTRYTRQPQKARDLLDGLAGDFLDTGQKELVKTLREELAGL